MVMHNYHDKHGHFPPWAVYGEDGQPLLSWRVLVLPWVEEEGLFRQFRLDEPWDSPHNSALIPLMPRIYKTKGDAPTDPYSTYFQVFVGKGAIFDGKRTLTLAEITAGDGTSNTLLIVEAENGVPWSKPADLAFEENRPLPPLGGMFKERFSFTTLSYQRQTTFRALWADGHVTSVSKNVDEQGLRAAITWNGGEKLPPELNQ